MYSKTPFRKPLPSEIEELEAVEVESKPKEEDKFLLFDCRYSEEEMKKLERDWASPCGAVIEYNPTYGLPIKIKY